MVALAVWYLSNFFRRDGTATQREPSGKLQDYLTTALLDTDWVLHRNALRRSIETVLRGGPGDDRVVATLWVRFRTTLAGVVESVVLDTADYTIELETRRGFVWPWQLNRTSKTYRVDFDGDALGSIEVGPVHAIARDGAGDVARWLTGEHSSMQPYEGRAPHYGQLIGRASGKLRVPLRRLDAARDFNDRPFFTEVHGDEKWLTVFLALAAAQSLTLQAR